MYRAHPEEGGIDVLLLDTPYFQPQTRAFLLVVSSAALQCDLRVAVILSAVLWPCFVSDSVLNRLLAAPMSAPQQRGLCDHELLAERGRSVTLLASWIRDCLLTFTVTLVTHILNPSHILSFNMIRCLACGPSHHHISHTISCSTTITLTIFSNRDIS